MNRECINCFYYKCDNDICNDCDDFDLWEPAEVDLNMVDYSAKADAGKLRLTLCPTSIIRVIAEIREYGSKKYGSDDNWRNVEIQRYRDAAYRHWAAYVDDPRSMDEESGLKHLHHLACNIAFLIEMEEL